LPELRAYRLQLSDVLPLRVGVRDLPEFLSPVLASTDAEKQALELLFESLVRARDDPQVGQTFEPDLARGTPQVMSLGRRFELVRDAYGSTGDRVPAADVRDTLNLLRKDRASSYYCPSWAELVQGPLPGKNAFEVGIRLKQGFLEPLSLMTFKILP